jgi:phage tail-like protein
VSSGNGDDLTPGDVDEEQPSADGGDAFQIEGTREITGFVTYTGEGFAIVRAAAEKGEQASPAPASTRRYLRDGLPAMYQDGDFGMRFVGALEQVLDPVIALLDTMPAHFDPDLAPLDILDLETRWLGLQHNEAQPASQLRQLVARASELGRLRGTRAGMEMTLMLNFPDLPLRVEDGGGVAWSVDGDLPEPGSPAFVVYCDEPLSKEEASEVARVIEAVKPANVGYRLRVKGPRRK